MLRLTSLKKYVSNPGSKIDKLLNKNPAVTNPLEQAKTISDASTQAKYPAYMTTEQGRTKSAGRSKRNRKGKMRPIGHYKNLDWLDPLAGVNKDGYTNKTARQEYHYDNVDIQFISEVQVMIIYIPKIEEFRGRAKTQLAYAEGLMKFNNLYTNALIFKNPNTQILTYYNTGPTPYIEVKLDGIADSVYVDCTGKTDVEILHHLQKVFGKTAEEKALLQTKPKTEYFGSATIRNLEGCTRDCMCRAEGQYPCPRYTSPHVVTDKRVIGKYLKNTDMKSDPYGLNIDWEKVKLTEDYKMEDPYADYVDGKKIEVNEEMEEMEEEELNNPPVAK